MSVALVDRPAEEGEPLPEQSDCPKDNSEQLFDDPRAWDHFMSYIVRHLCSDGSQPPALCFEQGYAPSNGNLRKEQLELSATVTFDKTSIVDRYSAHAIFSNRNDEIVRTIYLAEPKSLAPMTFSLTCLSSPVEEVCKIEFWLYSVHDGKLDRFLSSKEGKMTISIVSCLSGGSFSSRAHHAVKICYRESWSDIGVKVQGRR